MASPSSSSLSAPAFSSRSWKHHVFLSFRGEDTRNNFVGHLYAALQNNAIHTYKDDKKLSLGEEISPSLIEAIEQSQIAIVVFSENYADSSWCLNELRHIMMCKENRGLIVVPIFYGVEPSVVRKQKQKYKKAFAKHKSKNKANVESWRKALVEACGNCGQDFKSGNIDEAELIKKIVNEILKMTRPLTPRPVNDKLVGIEARMDALISKLQIGSDCVLMIGVWGVGGGGKTTLANSVYSRISWEFDGCCCIENIREQSSKNGLAKLQGELISGVLKQDKVRVRSIQEGKDMIMDRFSGKKVLVVLDDVDQREQLEALAGSIDWFSKGSRIIITTRNEHLLKAHKVDVHNLSLLNNDEATKLLRKCARLEDGPMEVYEQLLKEVVSYASGLPLALKVLGSFLCERDINEWKSTLARLKKIPDDDIVEKLRISYDGLKKVEQDLFLDIACYFRRYHIGYAMPILDACGLYPDIGLKVLREKALITISDGKHFDMHDLVQEMGHHIVRGKQPDNPEKHSRIWKQEDVLTICAMDATTDIDMIEAVRFRYNDRFTDRVNLLQHLPPIVANTKNLRWIDWEGEFASPLITNFPQRKLCCLILDSSLQKQLWEGYKFLPNLKIMELWNSQNLIMLPSFDGLLNLESFKLCDAWLLEEIHSSLGLLEKLVCLFIERCIRIKKFPSINRLKNLKTLSFRWCPGLLQLSEIQQKMDRSPHPHSDNNGDSDTQVIKPQEDLINDVQEYCLKQPSLPHNNMNHHTRLWFYRADLTKLNLSKCKLIDEDIGSSEWDLPHLQELDLSQNGFSRLDFTPWRLPRLKWLSVSDCDALVELSNLPSSIAVVKALYCFSLERFGDTSNCKWLWKVSIEGGYKLDPFDGERLLNSMLQGNAIENHFISVTLENQIPKGFVGSLSRGKIFTLRGPRVIVKDMFTLRLPDDWCSDFCGFLLRVVSNKVMINMDINIEEREPHEDDSRFEIWKESDEALEPEYAYDGEVRTFVGYVSFGSLRQITSLSSSYNTISFYMDSLSSSFAVELVPMKSRDDAVQKTKVETDSSEYWDEVDEVDKSFRIQQNSKSNVNIHWVANQI